MEKDINMNDIKKIYTCYCKLLDTIQGNKQYDIISNVISFVLDLANLSQKSFQNLNYSKKHISKEINKNKRLNQPKKIFHNYSLSLLASGNR